MEKCKLKANSTISSETILDSVNISDEFVEEEMGSYIRNFDAEGHKITIYILERYFYRITSTLTVTLIIEQTEKETTIEIISGGGKVSNMWGFWLTSWGAEKSAIKDIIAALKQLGFEEVVE